MIQVLFQTESHFPVKKSVVKDAVTQALLGKISSKAEVSVTIVGDRRMRELNNTYRKLDATTDVLSFPQNDPSQSNQPFVDHSAGIMRLGDIVVSVSQAARGAEPGKKKRQ